MAWYNSSWLKKKKITLTGGASGAIVNYQVKLTVTYESSMKTDFSDLRFTNGAEDTLLDCWLESYTASTSAIVWVETDTPANTVEADIYMYYGNSGASSDWSIRNTMLDGDDFTGSSLDTAIWDSQYCNTAVSAGKLTISTFSGGPRYGGGIKGKRAIAPSCVIEAKVKQLATAGHTTVGVRENWDIASAYDHQNIGFMYNNLMYGWNKNDSTQSLINKSGLTVVQEYKYKIVNNGTNVAYTYDGTAITGSPITTNVPNENMYMSVSGDNNHTISTEIDWIFIHKYAANPATYVFGSEESESVTGGMWYYQLLRRRN